VDTKGYTNFGVEWQDRNVVRINGDTVFAQGGVRVTIKTSKLEYSVPDEMFQECKSKHDEFVSAISAKIGAGIQTETGKPGQVETILVTPQDITLNMGTTQQFKATGYDADGNEVKIEPVWRLATTEQPYGDIGTLSPTTFIVGIFSESELFLGHLYPISDSSLIGIHMRINKTKVFDFLMGCQIEKGGYTGNDIAKLAKNIPVSPQALRKQINYWASTDQAFHQLTYLGQRTISITLDDFILIDQWLKEKPLGRMSDILREINDNQQKQGKNPIPQSTFYRFINSQKESLTGDTPRELQWLILFGINVVDTYNIANARASLSTVFSYSDLKTFGGIDIDSLASRLQEAQKWFQQTYPGADPFEWFPRIRLRSKVIRNHLSRIKADESLSDQALLIFEAQVDFIVRLKDILIDELIHKMGWIQTFLKKKSSLIIRPRKFCSSCAVVSANGYFSPKKKRRD
jgi:hypothetical protein